MGSNTTESIGGQHLGPCRPASVNATAGEGRVPMKRMACIGECMVELSEHPDGMLTRGFGGDTLNTALYLARLGVAVDYVTALGTDPFSDEMVQAWAAEG